MATAPLIAVVGMAGAGKSTVAGYLQDKHWRRVTLGDLTREELDRRGLPYIQQNERVVREELRRQHGPDAYARLILPRLQESFRQGPTVVDGLYSWAEYIFLKGHLPQRMWVLAVFTDRPLRYQRLAHRPVRALTPEEAEARDIAEIEKLDKGGPIAMADYTLMNNGSADSLYASIERALLAIEANEGHQP